MTSRVENAAAPAIAQLLVGCSRIHETRAFLGDLLGLDCATLRSDPPLLPGYDLRLRAECAVYSGTQPQRADTVLHLVEFDEPGPPVRAGAGPFDACPKTINFLCRDLPDVYRALAGRGARFVSHWVEYEQGGIHYRDVHLTGPDALNIGLLELVGGDYEVNGRGVGAVAAACFTQDAPTAAALAAGALGLPLAFDEVLAGEAVETLVGLPPGGALMMQLYGGPEARGRLEFVSYRGAAGDNRYGRARPPATGLLHPRVRAGDLGGPALAERRAGTALRLGPPREGTLLGAPVLSRLLEVPGGLRIELVEDR
jgi:hypothetical protein